MGTSVSQQSPKTLNWQAVRAAYNSDAVPVTRIAREVWRAATNQPVGNLANELASPFVAQCLRAASDSDNVAAALSNVRRAAALSGEASLAVDLAQRAIVSAFQARKNRNTAMVAALFSEASNYLVSRDLPGHVGASERTASVSTSAAFKDEICSRVSTVVAALPQKKAAFGTTRSWQAYVQKVVATLQGQG